MASAVTLFDAWDASDARDDDARTAATSHVGSFDPDDDDPALDEATPRKATSADRRLAREAYVLPAEPGDGCTLSTCRAPGRYRIGWATPGETPTVWHSYCRPHAAPWTGDGPPARRAWRGNRGQGS